MKIENYQFPKSSFLSIEKDMEILTNLILKNDRLQKLLFHTTPMALKGPNLTDEQQQELFGKNIKIVPKVYIDNDLLNYIIIRFDNFLPNIENPQFRNNILEFDILCHFDQWYLQDFQLRPFRIAAEIDSMINNKHLSGIGTLQFLGAKVHSINEEYGALILMYSAIHGEEDKKFDLNPVNNKDIIENFNQIFNED